MGQKGALDREEMIQFVLACWDEDAGRYISTIKSSPFPHINPHCMLHERIDLANVQVFKEHLAPIRRTTRTCWQR
jgi:hypothetical protein